MGITRRRKTRLSVLVFLGIMGAMLGCLGSGCALELASPTCSYRFAVVSVWDFNNSDAPSTAQHIRIVNSRGSYATVLTRNTAYITYSPQLSPNGSFITYYSAQVLSGADQASSPTANNVWKVKIDGTELQHLTNLSASGITIGSPSISPDSSKIAYISNRKLDGSDAQNTNGISNIWVINADGTNDHAITSLTAASITVSTFPAPSWTTDSASVIYSSTRKLDGSDALATNSVLNLWKSNATTGAAVALTSNTANGTYNNLGGLSPDGNYVLAWAARALSGSDAAGTNNVPNIWKIPVSGSGTQTPLTSLTAAGVNAAYPVYSRDGTKISYYSKRALDGSDALATNSVRNIWIMNSDGSGNRALTQLSSSASLHAMGSSFPWSFFVNDDSALVYMSNRKLDGSDALNNGSDVNNVNLWRINVDGTGNTPLTRLSTSTTGIAFTLVPTHQRVCSEGLY